MLASVDAIAARMGLSRTEYIRRRLAQDARTFGISVTPRIFDGSRGKRRD